MDMNKRPSTWDPVIKYFAIIVATFAITALSGSILFGIVALVLLWLYSDSRDKTKQLERRVSDLETKSKSSAEA